MYACMYVCMYVCIYLFIYLFIYMGVEGVNSGPQACTENTLATEPSPTLYLLPFLDNIPM